MHFFTEAHLPHNQNSSILLSNKHCSQCPEWQLLLSPSLTRKPADKIPIRSALKNQIIWELFCLCMIQVYI